MIINVANPIYDSVFKYLMEDKRVAELLTVFDQTNRDSRNRQVLNIDDAEYEDDDEMRLILHRLLAAASDAKLRQDMNVEDEYFSAIENRDTAIMLRDQKIAEKDKLLEKKAEELVKKDEELVKKAEELEKKDLAIISSVKALKKMGMSLEEISQMVGIPKDELEQL